MTGVVVDASVVVKWLLPEELTDEALRLLDQTTTLSVPDLVDVEVANVLWKRVQRQQMTLADARDALRELRESPVTRHASRELLSMAMDIATAYGRTIYDGIYVALAVTQDCPLITSDERLVNSLSRSKLKPHLVHLRNHQVS